MRLRKGVIDLGWFAFFLLVLASVGLAQTTPNPGDSLIIESKVVAPGFGSAIDTSAYVYFRVWITNIDTLYAVSIPMVEKSVSGGAYVILGRPRTSAGIINRLTNTLSNLITVPVRYHSDSPDSLTIAGFALDSSNTEPPNPTRKPLWEIKFDSVLSNLGTVELDTVTHILGIYPTFTNTSGISQYYNFIKSMVTVCPAVKGDLNCDADQRPEDVILMLYCVFWGTGNCEPSFTDVDCDGGAGSTDVVLLLNEIFLDIPFPC